MKARYSKEDDALYLELDPSPVQESEEVSPGVVLDFNASNELVGIEILGLKGRIPEDRLNKIDFEVA